MLIHCHAVMLRAFASHFIASPSLSGSMPFRCGSKPRGPMPLPCPVWPGFANAPLFHARASQRVAVPPQRQAIRFQAIAFTSFAFAFFGCFPLRSIKFWEWPFQPPAYRPPYLQGSLR
jgi:hypothetical protein